MISNERLRESIRRKELSWWIHRDSTNMEFIQVNPFDIAQELLTLREEKVKCEFYIQEMVRLSGEMAHEKELLIEDAERLYKVAFGSLVNECMDTGWTAPELKAKYRKQHNALMEQMKGGE